MATSKVPKTSTRAVLVDMDGVLIDGMRFHVQAWLDAFNAFGVSVDEHLFYLFEGMPSRSVVDNVCRELSLSLTSDARAAIATRKRATYAETFKVVPLEGGPTLIRSLNGFGYTLALVTGAPLLAASATLHELHFENAFTTIVSGEATRNGKPYADPYLAALTRLGTRRSQTLVVENSPPGLASAHAARLPCLAVATYVSTEALSSAERVFRNLHDMTEWFRAEYVASGGIGQWRWDSDSAGQETYRDGD